MFVFSSLQKSVPYAIKCCPETSIHGNWLEIEIGVCISHLKNISFAVRAIITDDRTTNVRAFNHLLQKNNEISNHNAYKGTMITSSLIYFIS